MRIATRVGAPTAQVKNVTARFQCANVGQASSLPLEFGHFPRSPTSPTGTNDALSPEGRIDNSPALQGWDGVARNSSPEGTVESP